MNSLGSRQDWRHGVRQLGQKGNTAEDPHISEGSDRALDRLSNSVVDDCRDTLAKFHAMATIRRSLSSWESHRGLPTPVKR
jgi:hypothetical protein